MESETKTEKKFSVWDHLLFSSALIGIIWIVIHLFQFAVWAGTLEGRIEDLENRPPQLAHSVYYMKEYKDLLD